MNEYDQDKLDFFRKKLNEPPNVSLKGIEDFLSAYFTDADSWDEAIRDIDQFSHNYPRTIIRDLQALEQFLATSHEKGVLANLVAWEANWVLDDPSDKGAREWLEKVAATIREILGDKAPTRP